MEEWERKAYLADYTDFHEMPQDIRDAFLTRVGTVRERGYEIADGERFVGGLDVGVLVGTPGSTVRAALIVATLRSADGPDAQKILKAVRVAGDSITERVGLAKPRKRLRTG